MVTVFVAVQPPILVVAIMVPVPTDAPVASPVTGSIVTTVGMLGTVLQVTPPGVALLIVVVLRLQKPLLPRIGAGSWFTVTFVGKGGGQRVVTRVSGGDPGYDETAKMLAEAALCLVLDELPDTAGQVTTAQAMGDALLDRLQKASIAFDVIS